MALTKREEILSVFLFAYDAIKKYELPEGPQESAVLQATERLLKHVQQNVTPNDIEEIVTDHTKFICKLTSMLSTNESEK